jgi:hypothetical protein
MSPPTIFSGSVPSLDWYLSCLTGLAFAEWVCYVGTVARLVHLVVVLIVVLPCLFFPFFAASC